jgi:threonine/homoserine/homoserine lactone efflux protein
MKPELVFFLKGLLAGFLIAAPTGPIGILCARRTLTIGRRAGFASGMGAATADAIYGFVAAFGLTFVSDMISEHQAGLRLAGGFLLCFLGIKTFFARTDPESGVKTGKLYAGLYSSTFILTMTNPMTIFSFAAVFAGFGLAAVRGSVLSAGILIAGVFLGSGIWWLALIGAFTFFKKHLNSGRRLQWINRAAGVFIAASGILALLSLEW